MNNILEKIGIEIDKTKSPFIKIAQEIGELVTEKNEAYGSAFEKAGEILKVLFPNGIPVEKYTDVLIMVRMLDKFFRIANKKDAFGESPYKDITGYGILGTFKDTK